MIEAFLSWWVQQLAACLPRGLRPATGPVDGTVATLLPDGGVRVARRRAGRTGPAATVSAATVAAETGLDGAVRAVLGSRPGPVVLAVPAELMLRRSVELPLAAERDLGSVLRYEMDRLTPFTAGEVDWTWSVRHRDKARSRVRLDLLLAPRTLAAPLRTAFAASGHPVAALESPAGIIDLRAGRGGKGRRRLLAVQAAVCAVLSVAAVAVPFARQSLQSRRVEARIAAVRPAVDRVEALRRRIAAGSAGTDVVATQEAATGDALSVLALVTTALPDDTFLSELAWQNRHLTMTGQSTAASRLIEALSREPAIRNPVFAAPITRDEAARVDRFSIRAELLP